MVSTSPASISSSCVVGGFTERVTVLVALGQVITFSITMLIGDSHTDPAAEIAVAGPKTIRPKFISKVAEKIRSKLMLNCLFLLPVCIGL